MRNYFPCKKKHLYTLALLLTVLALLSPFNYAQAGESYSKDPAWREAVDAAIQRYIRAHPEVIVEAIQALEAKKKTEESERSKRQIATHQAELLKDPTSPASGNPNGDIVVVEFFDYRCLFCKQVAGALKQIQAEDKNIRIVYKDFPILGEQSTMAAKAALAARIQGKHLAFHEALLASENELTRDEIFQIATRVGLDVRKLETEMQSPDIQSILDHNRSLGIELGISGTPGFIAGNELRLGALEYKELKELVAQARAAKARAGKS